DAWREGANRHANLAASAATEVITPRRTRLVRVPDLHAFRFALAEPAPRAAGDSAAPADGARARRDGAGGGTRVCREDAGSRLPASARPDRRDAALLRSPAPAVATGEPVRGADRR